MRFNPTPSISAIKNAVPLGTVKLDDQNKIKPKAYFHTGIAWVKDGFNHKSMQNNQTVKDQFLVELGRSCVFLGKTRTLIENKIGYLKPGPLTVRTAKAAIKIARNQAYYNFMHGDNPVGEKVKLGLLKFFSPLLGLLRIKPRPEWIDSGLKNTGVVSKESQKDHNHSETESSSRAVNTQRKSSFEIEDMNEDSEFIEEEVIVSNLPQKSSKIEDNN